MKRKVKLVVISDVHLGTYGCHARELLHYLNGIHPKVLVLNGDIFDIWQFRKRYFPKSHMQIIKKILSMAAKGVKVYYLPGNHDEKLRKFNNSYLGNIIFKDTLTLNLDGKRALFFHGDVFDASIKHAKWLAKLGGWSYDLLILLNRAVNFTLVSMGRDKFSLSKRIKDNVKKAVSFINDFEDNAIQFGLENNADFVICGHIHKPEIRPVKDKKRKCIYLNSGDWVENLTALEYNNKTWKIFFYNTKERLMKLDAQKQEDPNLVTQDEPEIFSALSQLPSDLLKL